MQTTNALLVVPKNLVRSDVGALGQFMFALQQKYGAALVIEKNAVWSSFPFLEVVSCGMVSLAVAFAKKFEIQIRHDTDLHEIGKYLDRVLNAGLILKYATATDAVEDFDQKVVKKVQQRIEEKKMGTFTALAEDVAYSFFADVYASAKKFWEKTIKPAMDVAKSRLAKAHEPNKIALMNEDNYLGGIELILRAFEIKYHLPTVSRDINGVPKKDIKLRFENGRMIAFELRAKIEKTLQVIDLLARLPVNLGRLAEVGYVGADSDHTVTIEYHWITTQVMRIRANLDDGECINESEILKADAAKPQNVKVLTNKLIARMKKRGMRLRPGDSKILSEIIKDIEPNAKKGFLEAHDKHVRGLGMFYVTEYDPKFLTQEASDRFLQDYKGRTSKQDRDLIYKHIAESYPKLLIEREGVTFCLENRLLTKQQILEIVKEYPHKENRIKWAEEVLSNCRDGEEYWKYKQIFVYKGIVDFQLFDAIQNIAHLSTEFVDKFIATTEVFAEYEPNIDWNDCDRLVILLEKISKNKLRKLMNDNRLDEYTFGSFVGSLLELKCKNTDIAKKERKIIENLKKVIKIIDDPWWIIEQMLCSAINDRCVEIEDVLSQKEHQKNSVDSDDGWREPWGEGVEKKIIEAVMSKIPELKIATLEEIITKFPELEIAKKCLKKKVLNMYKKYRKL